MEKLNTKSFRQLFPIGCILPFKFELNYRWNSKFWDLGPFNFDHIISYSTYSTQEFSHGIIWDEVPTMVEIAIFWFQIHITNGFKSLHRKWHTGNQYRVKSAENRMRSNLKLLQVMNVKKWLKIAVCSSPLDWQYH
jgi:hypothetical protein